LARYTGPRCRICRRERLELYLKGDRCYGDKCAVRRRNYPPGQHGQGRPKFSDYGQQLREKQKARRIYGVMEKQFRRYFTTAQRRKGLTGLVLLQMLERRLDNVVYRMGLASSRAQARQLVQHGHVDVNGQRLDAPSHLVKVGDEVRIRSASHGRAHFKGLARELADGGVTPPRWLSIDPTQLAGRVMAEPGREDIDVRLNEQLIVEYYSR